DRRRTHGRCFRAGCRSRDDQGGKLPQGTARLGERDRAAARAWLARTFAGRLWRRSVSPEPASATHGARRSALIPMNELDEQSLAQRVVSAMMAKDAFSQWLRVEVVAVRPNAAT